MAVRSTLIEPKFGGQERDHFDAEIVQRLNELNTDSDGVDTKADTAQSTADGATTDAATAQSTADTVTSDLATHEALAATEGAQAHVKKATAVADVASADATDLPTALTLVNELKAQVNAMLASERTAAQRTT